jgi:Cu/Ag efflux protein CusF
MKTSLTSLTSLPAVFALAVGLMPPTFAAGMDGGAGMDMKPAAKAMTTPQPVSAEVRKVDPAAGKVTLKHGPIMNLGMPPMTMAFPVKDPAMLANLKEGDKVSATFDNVDGRITVTDLRK